jgi:hypothetical protein
MLRYCPRKINSFRRKGKRSRQNRRRPELWAVSGRRGDRKLGDQARLGQSLADSDSLPRSLAQFSLLWQGFEGDPSRPTVARPFSFGAAGQHRRTSSKPAYFLVLRPRSFRPRDGRPQGRLRAVIMAHTNHRRKNPRNPTFGHHVVRWLHTPDKWRRRHLHRIERRSGRRQCALALSLADIEQLPCVGRVRPSWMLLAELDPLW